jgi:hypothetical protein
MLKEDGDWIELGSVDEQKEAKSGDSRAAFGPAPALSYALIAAVSVVIIACPWALGLATSMSISA